MTKVTSVMPKRIQRERKRGWRLPLEAVYVGRPSRYGNLFKVGQRFQNLSLYINLHGPMTQAEIDQWHADGGLFIATPAEASAWYRKYLSWRLSSPDTRRQWVRDLAGRDLACWCPLFDTDGSRFPCHGDILLEEVNRNEQ